jgi:hypothetical protein
MIRCTWLILTVVVMLVAAMALPALAAPGEHEGRDDQDPTGKPDDPDCWGEVTEQFASDTSDEFTLGQHSSNPDPRDEDPDTPRQGVGNVARTDTQEGDTPSDHGALVGPLFGAKCEPGPESS